MLLSVFVIFFLLLLLCCCVVALVVGGGHFAHGVHWTDSAVAHSGMGVTVAS